MRNAGGYSIITDPAMRAVEQDTFTCAHCHSITFTKSGFGPLTCAMVKMDGSVAMVEASHCQNCMQPICPRCSGKGCNPYLKQVEAEEKAARKLILP